MKILSYNPGHDGAVVDLVDGRLEMSIEADKNSDYRYSPISGPDVLSAIGELEDTPDGICMSGWWPRDHHEFLHGSLDNAGYRGVSKENVIVGERRFLPEEASILLVVPWTLPYLMRIRHVATSKGHAMLCARLGGRDRRLL